MKGFMHIVEILLVAMLVFMAFTQFSSIPKMSEEWSDIKLGIMAGDILKALDTKGVNWFNKTEMNQELNRTMPKNMIYSVILENVIKPEIKVGCFCDSSELNIIKKSIDPGNFVINDANITIEIIQINSIDELFSLEFDTVLIYGYEDFSSNPYPLMNFLDKDKGVIEIFNPEIIDNTQKTIFGLDSDLQSASTGNIKFTEMSSTDGTEANKIYDYFFHMPLFSDYFNDDEQWITGSGGDLSESMGNPSPSMMLTGGGESSFISTTYYRDFETGDIDFDIYLENGAAAFIGFRKSGGNEYMASISTDTSIGYDSFYSKNPLTSMGSNSSHITSGGEWNHVKIVALGGELFMYVNGNSVATAVGSGTVPANITMFSSGGLAYVDNLRITHRESPNFDNFLDQGENTTQVNNDAKRVILNQLGTSLPACIINYNIEGIGNGRTVWISNSTNQNSQEYKTLLKSAIAWAAGDTYEVVSADIKNPVQSHMYKAYNRDMFQNVKILMQLSYLY